MGRKATWLETRCNHRTNLDNFFGRVIFFRARSGTYKTRVHNQIAHSIEKLKKMVFISDYLNRTCGVQL